MSRWTSSRSPFPRTTLTSDRLNLALYRTRAFRQPLLTFEDRDMRERLARLRERGFMLSDEMPDSLDDSIERHTDRAGRHAPVAAAVGRLKRLNAQATLPRSIQREFPTPRLFLLAHPVRPVKIFSIFATENLSRGLYAKADSEPVPHRRSGACG